MLIILSATTHVAVATNRFFCQKMFASISKRFPDSGGIKFKAERKSAIRPRKNRGEWSVLKLAHVCNDIVLRLVSGKIKTKFVPYLYEAYIMIDFYMLDFTGNHLSTEFSHTYSATDL